jgi:N-acetylglutamate synthase-like GNAT family acetyltransferase
MSTRPHITSRSAPANGLLGMTPACEPALAQRPKRYVARRARAADADAVHALISHYAAQGLLLPRTKEDVRTNMDHFLVLSLAGRIVGCVALEPYGAELAEIRSLAVAAKHAGGGRGARLARFALAIAKRRRIARVFAVTHAPEFFERLGFARTDRQSITEKAERDCRACPKQASCKLVALVCTVLPHRAGPPVLNTEHASVPA